MRHRKHSNQLGVKKEHRAALMANLAVALILEGRIRTTLKKAKALRPFVERLVTLSKKGGLSQRRIAAARLRSPEAVQMLFDERATEFANRPGGYTRIYKLGARTGDAAEMALIEFVGANDENYRSGRRKSAGAKAAAKAGATATAESQADAGGAAVAVETEKEPAAETGEKASSEPEASTVGEELEAAQPESEGSVEDDTSGSDDTAGEKKNS